MNAPLPLRNAAAPKSARDDAAARAIAAGVRTLWESHGVASLTEVTLPNARRADVMGLERDGRVRIAEVKSGVPDFQADAKWPDYLGYCDAFFFAVGPQFPLALLPDDVGVIVADHHGGAVVRPAPISPLAPARRKALTLRVARLAAERLARADGIDAAWGAGPI